MISDLTTLAPTLDGRERQEALGQFLTPSPVGDFMASLFSTLPRDVRLIDAGAGAGALTVAFVRRACAKGSGVKSIHATAYELDTKILPALQATLAECESLCRTRGVSFTTEVHHADFIQTMAGKLSGDLFSTSAPLFNVAIANPPYKKINTASPERLALRSVGLETSNLYTGFVGLLARLLDDGGQLVAITPRSFCNGPYFRPFREDFLNQMELQRLHVFESRDAAFRDDAVLQENVIFQAIKGKAQPPIVTVSSSSGEAGASITAKGFPFAEIVYPNDAERFIHIPADTGHASATALLSDLPASLASLGLTVSTGRVVDFRLKNALRPAPGPGTVPLLYPCHFNGGTVHWPKLEARKPNAILDNAETRPWLVPSGLYLLTKRFTSKEERRRLVACLFDPADVKAEWIGFENHLNYFHANGKGLERKLALGLFVYLNSTLVDQYFRCFSGHTQVNATDLRKLAYPDRATLEAMGTALKRSDSSQDELDHLVEHHLHGFQQTRPQK
ncbi:MAG: Eco57I restriction-modification methylase domain-containing protein [Verrucomicrobiaceae bacterium]|nr:Eco57I restriction-modification methylase domain-containing protein [Verrucomicrobiaceae bacterium]